MRHFSTGIGIAATPERVWAVMTAFTQWHEWTSSVSSVEALAPDPAHVGSRFRVLQPGLRPAVWTITEIEPGRHFEWVTENPGVRVVARHTVEPAPGGSRALLSVEFGGLLGGLVGWLTRKLTSRYLAIEAQGLKTRSQTT